MDKVQVTLQYNGGHEAWNAVTFMAARPMVGDSLTLIEDQQKIMYVQDVAWRMTEDVSLYTVNWEMVVTLGDDPPQLG
jgi:hypothetical protein